MQPERQPRICSCGGHGFVPLTKGFTAFVSANRIAGIAQYRWWANTTGKGRVYAIGYVDGAPLLLHRYLQAPADGFDVDHRNGDTLDNRDGNLRTCTRANNKWNTRRSWGGAPYKGVYRTTSGKPWAAEIMANGRKVYLGRFTCPIDAARAYDAAAAALHGRFAATNAALGLLPAEAA
jgi:hypothetical protein